MNDYDWFGIILGFLFLTAGFYLTVGFDNTFCNYLLGPLFLSIGIVGLYTEWEQIT